MRRWRVLSGLQTGRRPDKAFTPHPASQYQILHRRFRSHRPGLTAPDRPARLHAVTGVLIIQRFDPEFVGGERSFSNCCIGTFPDGKRDGS